MAIFSQPYTGYKLFPSKISQFIFTSPIDSIAYNANISTTKRNKPKGKGKNIMPKFDDRAVCFHTGKKISPPMDERKICACCGQRIVKGEIVDIGHVGDDCADIIRRRLSDKICFQSTVEEFIAKWSKVCGKMKPAIRRTLEEFYP